ncbi:MAG: exodeoxyribonuclease VII large subunit [Clostridia bacterium]|nr:exodeoxyribonuclease VII large subunit [Clostridia bacterium]MBQ9749081.1 exodeoxyribonuclease VII large subunit [Clostridia bacterium]
MINERECPILTVSQITQYIKAMFASDVLVQSITVRGEISNLVERGGHMYMTLKDEGAVIKAVIFKASLVRLKFRPENNMNVVAHGRISVYEQSGQYQLYIDMLEPEGIGALAKAYEQLRKKLESEGLFDRSRKKALPKIPKRIGVITSPAGAAVRDMINVLGRRFPLAEMIIFPSLVQGEDAPKQLASGVRYFNRTRSVDVIIIGRGGGSLEDLWAFNDENLARTVAASEIPIISAVGHESDFTICDFVSDMRAPTPSAAAELAVPDRSELLSYISSASARLTAALASDLKKAKGELDLLRSRRVLRSPGAVLDDKNMRLLHITDRAHSSYSALVANKRAEFLKNVSKLEALDPLSVMTRGFSVAFDEKGSVVRSVTDVNAGDMIDLRVSDGNIKARVCALEKENGRKK